MVGREMRNVAQQVRTFSGQLLDVKRYEFHVDEWQDLTTFCRCNKALEEVQSEIPNLQARTSRIERSLAQVFDHMKQMEELNKTMMEGVRAICDNLNTALPSPTLRNCTGQEGI
jgi:methyl-accepting chemotaxis protein